MVTKTAYIPIEDSILEEYNRTRPLRSKPLFCYESFNNIFFSFNGKVISCPYNQTAVLGTYPQQTISEIWHSDEGKKLRAHLEHDDLSNGFKHCQHYLEKKKFSGLKPLVFDKYSKYQEEQKPKFLEFSLENTCNLECIMYSGEVSSSIRKNRDKQPPIQSPYDAKFAEQLQEFIPYAKVAKFYGGEPFMTPIYFSIGDKIYTLNKSMKLFTITNGTKLNTRIKEVIERQNLEIAVSIDGFTSETYSKIRKNTDFEVVMKNLDYFNNYCLKNGYPLTISFTAMRANWKELPEMVKLCNKMRAHIYISYVHKPFDLALWNLSSVELGEMISYRKSLSLPIDSFLVRHKKFNKQAYNDFIVYLEGCFEKNKENESKKQSLHSSADEHIDHDFSDSQNQTPIELISKIPNAKAVFDKRILEYKDQITAEKYLAFAEKTQTLFNIASVEESVFYTLLLLGPVHQIVDDVLSMSDIDLEQIIRTKAQEVK